MRRYKTEKSKRRAPNRIKVTGAGAVLKAGICIQVKTMTPKKPNSACAKSPRALSNNKSHRLYPAKVKLQELHGHVRGGRVRDLPASLPYRPRVLDCGGVEGRNRAVHVTEKESEVNNVTLGYKMLLTLLKLQ